MSCFYHPEPQPLSAIRKEDSFSITQDSNEILSGVEKNEVIDVLQKLPLSKC